VTAFGDLLGAELTPLVRRMADRPPGDAAYDAENRRIRAMVGRLLAGHDRPGDGQRLAGTAEALGSALYQGPLLDTACAADLLSRAGLAGLVTPGTSIALAVRTHGAADPADPAPIVAEHGTISARRCFVGFADEVERFVVVGHRLALVPRDHPTVTVRRYEETGRGQLFDVRFAATPVSAWIGGPEHWAQALAGARIRQAAYLVGLAQAALDLAVEHAKRRRQFGQPIGRFQALAFRLAELSIRVDASRLLTRDAARCADEDAGSGREVRLAAAQCLATAAELARAVTTAAMQIQGAAGLTLRSDAQLFYRRAAVEALWWGSPTQLRAGSAGLLAARVG
jgi:hypothetical protein